MIQEEETGKLCLGCHSILPLTDFAKDTKQYKNGKIYYRNYCKKCIAKKNRERYIQNKIQREKIMKGILLGKGHL